MCSRCWSRSPRAAIRCSLRTSRAKALATLVVNKLRGTLQVCAVKAPGFGDRRKAMLQDIATTGGKAITEDLGIKLENVQMADLGQAKKITVDKDNTTVIECPSFQVLDCNSAMSRSRQSLAGSRIADFTLKLIWAPGQPTICPARKLPRYATIRQIKGPR